MRSYNDDLVMSLAIACWIRDTALQVNKREVEYQKAMINSMYKSDSTMNTTIKGMQGYDKTINEKANEYVQSVAPFAWIYKG